MKRFVLISFLILLASTAHASTYVNGWIHAMQNKGAGLNSIITHDFEYRQISFQFGKRLSKWSKGDIPFFAKASKPSTIDVEDTRGGPGGQVVILNTTSENGLYREWETILLIRSDGIARVTEIAKEGQIRGYPPGCPETMYKRNFILTLRGTPSGFNSLKIIKLYKYSRDTDPLEYAHPRLGEKELKKCEPTPDRHVTFSEVLVLDQNLQAEYLNSVGTYNGNKRAGAKFFREDGTNFPGRLFDLGGGKEGLLLTFTAEKDSSVTDIAKLYVWRGSGWSSVWGFDVGHGTRKGFAGGTSDNFEWSLKSTPGPSILARMVTNNDPKYDCSVGTQITYERKGSGFKPVKSGQPAACFKRDLGVSLTASAGSDERPKHVVTEEDVDWRFQY